MIPSKYCSLDFFLLHVTKSKTRVTSVRVSKMSNRFHTPSSAPPSITIAPEAAISKICFKRYFVAQILYWFCSEMCSNQWKEHVCNRCWRLLVKCRLLAFGTVRMRTTELKRLWCELSLRCSDRTRIKSSSLDKARVIHRGRHISVFNNFKWWRFFFYTQSLFNPPDTSFKISTGSQSAGYRHLF